MTTLDTTTSTKQSLAATTAAATSAREALDDIAKRLRKQLRTGAMGDVAVSVEVVKLADNWSRYKGEAGGLEIGPWLRKHVDPRRALAWYRRKAHAYAIGKRLGFATYVDSVALPWIVDAVPPGNMPKVGAVLQKAYKENKDVPLNQAQVARALPSFVARRKSRMWASDELKAAKSRIDRLEAQVRRLGEEPVE